MQVDQVTTGWLRQLQNRAEAVFGDILPKARRRYRNRGSGHRLLKLIDNLDRCTPPGSAMSDDQTMDIAELTGAVEMCEHWSSDEVWPSIRSGMVANESFRHAVMQLGFARHYEDGGNIVGLQVERASRVSDLWVAGEGANVATQRVHVEMKTPLALDRPERRLSAELAEGVVEKAFRASRGQLPRNEPGLLVLGGFNLRDVDVVVIGEQVARHFRRNPGRHPQLLGVVTFFARPRLDLVLAGSRGEQIHQLSVPTYADLFRNDAYEGPARIVMS